MSIDLQKSNYAPKPKNKRKTVKLISPGSVKSLYFWKKKQENIQISKGNAVFFSLFSQPFQDDIKKIIGYTISL